LRNLKDHDLDWKFLRDEVVEQRSRMTSWAFLSPISTL
jgi:hypothetical protein